MSSWAFPWAVGVPGDLPERRMSAWDLIDEARALGLGLVQIADNMPLHEFDADQLCRLREHAEAQGISIEVGTAGT